MPPKTRTSRDDIIAAGIAVVRDGGPTMLNARELAKRIGISTQPIFSNFSSMKEVYGEVIASASKLYRSFLKEDMDSGKYPKYKASGMAYIRFAREEPELFKLLFMRDRHGETTDDTSSIKEIIDIIMQSLGMDHETALLFHLQIWSFVHGIAVMIATGYLDWEEGMISTSVTDVYMGLKARYEENIKNDSCQN